MLLGCLASADLMADGTDETLRRLSEDTSVWRIKIGKVIVSLTLARCAMRTLHRNY